MKRILGALGFVLGPIVGSVFYGYLRFVNRGGRWEATFEDNTHAQLMRGARGVPKSAITFGSHVFCRRKMPSFALVRHELTHVRQYKQYGWFGFLARYGREQALRGYAGNRLEQEARNHAGL